MENRLSTFTDIRTQKTDPTNAAEPAKFLKRNADGGAEVHVLGGAISIPGTVTVTGEVEVKNDSGNPIPVSGTVTATGPLTDAQLRATPVPVSGTVATTGLTDAELRATPVPVSGTVTTGGLTDAQLRASPVPISGTVTATPTGTQDVNLVSTITVPVSGTFFQATQPVSGPLTDTQLRATPVPVSGTVATGGLTDTQLRAAPVPISGTVTATGTVAVTQSTSPWVTNDPGLPNALGQSTMAGSTSVAISSDQSAVPISGTVTVTPSGTQDVNLTKVNGVAQLTGTGATGTGSERVTVAVDSATVAGSASLPTGANTIGKVDQGTGGASAWKVDGSAVTQPVSGTFFQATQPVSGTFFQVTQPVSGPLTDTQLRATPVPVSGTVTATGAVAVTQSTSPWVTNDPGLPDTLGQKTMAGSTGVVIASDQAAVPVSGTVAVSGTVGVTQSTSPWVTNDPGLPDTLGQKTMANSTGVVIASDQSAVPVSGTVTATGPLTDTQLRATPVPVSGTVTTGGLTDTQLRATPVPVSGTVAATQGTSPWVVSGTANPTTPSTLFGFVTAVPTAGSRVQLASHAVVAGILQAPSTNSGLIYVGDGTVSSSVYGAELQPGQASGIAIDNTNRIYIDASVSGDKCAFLGS